jgi:hypothetical protein
LRYLVLELGADVNEGDLNGWMLLGRCAEKGLLGAVQCLVEELGADVSKVDEKTGGSPLY